MKLILTSAGLSNKSIVNALLEMLDRPFSDVNLAFIPTAANVEEGDKGWLIDDFVNCKKLGSGREGRSEAKPDFIIGGRAKIGWFF